MRMIVTAGLHRREFEVANRDLKRIEPELIACRDQVGNENFQVLICHDNITHVLNWRVPHRG